MPDDAPPNTPFRTPWEPARRVTHLGEYSSPAALRKDLLDLRQRVDAGQLGDLSAEDLAQTIRELTEARDRLRGFARPTRGVLVTVAATFTGSGLLLAFLKMPSHAWAALAVAMVTAAVAALASEWAQRWLDAVPEYDGVISDLRKLTATGTRPKGAPGAPRAATLTSQREYLVDAALRAAEDAHRQLVDAEQRLASREFWSAVGTRIPEAEHLLERARSAVHDIEGAYLKATQAAKEAQRVGQGSDLIVAADVALESSKRAAARYRDFSLAAVLMEELTTQNARTGVRVDAQGREEDTPLESHSPGVTTAQKER